VTDHAGPLILRRRPLTVEAWQVTGANMAAVAEWCHGINGGDRVIVATDTGDFAHASVGDWVIRGPFGEFYPAPDKVVFATYESIVSVVAE
jgi:hypothetical protein